MVIETLQVYGKLFFLLEFNESKWERRSREMARVKGEGGDNFWWVLKLLTEGGHVRL